jgi:hypothetical protein
MKGVKHPMPFKLYHYQFLQTSLLNLGTLEGDVYHFLLIDSVLCDLKFFSNGALFCSPGE